MVQVAPGISKLAVTASGASIEIWRGFVEPLAPPLPPMKVKGELGIAVRLTGELE
jgi:hypothetical protein